MTASVSLELQIATLRAHADLAASYAASVAATPMLCGPAAQERDALRAALETLEGVQTLSSVQLPPGLFAGGNKAVLA